MVLKETNRLYGDKCTWASDLIDLSIYPLYIDPSSPPDEGSFLFCLLDLSPSSWPGVSPGGVAGVVGAESVRRLQGLCLAKSH